MRLFFLLLALGGCAFEFDETTRVRVHDPALVSVGSSQSTRVPPLLPAGNEVTEGPIGDAAYPRVARTAEGTIVKRSRSRGTTQEEVLVSGDTISLFDPGGTPSSVSLESKEGTLVLHEGDVDLSTSWSNVESIQKVKRPRHIGHHYWLPVDVAATALGAFVVSEGFAAHEAPGTRALFLGLGAVFFADGLLWTWLHLADMLGETKVTTVYP